MSLSSFAFNLSPETTDLLDTIMICLNTMSVILCLFTVFFVVLRR